MGLAQGAFVKQFQLFYLVRLFSWWASSSFFMGLAQGAFVEQFQLFYLVRLFS
jgi:hypothetical protein|tara:strand:- start:215 stop:373 length:159 start_codon:yes stop_codon:yes gene_type:complete